MAKGSWCRSSAKSATGRAACAAGVPRIDVPRQLTASQRELFELLRRSLAGEHVTGPGGAAPATFDGPAGAAAPGAAPNGAARPRGKGRKKNRGLFDKVKETLGLDEEAGEA